MEPGTSHCWQQASTGSYSGPHGSSTLNWPLLFQELFQQVSHLCPGLSISLLFLGFSDYFIIDISHLSSYHKQQ
jgi:hypothetical protein